MDRVCSHVARSWKQKISSNEQQHNFLRRQSVANTRLNLSKVVVFTYTRLSL